MQIHSDEPAETDGLQRQHLVVEIATIAATATPPLVLGVHGDWGSGKTSFMKHVRKELDGKHTKNVVTVWFEAWRYQNEPAPVVALLQEMRQAFSKWKKLDGRIKKLGEITIRTLLNSLNDLAKLVQLESLPFSAEKIQLLGEQWERENLESRLVVDSLQDSLQEAIKTLLPDSKDPSPRVVIFIDDLDRCNPEMAYRLLEGLKIYLNLNNCVFVLAMNQQIVIKAIASVMKKEDDDARVRLEAEAYLEKLCANIWRLPPPKLSHQYFTALLDTTQNTPIQAITDAAETSRPFLPPNPRRLKALANLYNRLWLRAMNTATIILDHSGQPTLALRILVVAYVYQFHSEFYQRWRHDPTFLEELRRWMQTGKPKLIQNKEGKDIPDPAFFALILPSFAKTDDGSPTPGATTITSNYPDPSAPGVFWIAPLLQGPLADDGPENYRDLLNLEQA